MSQKTAVQINIFNRLLHYLKPYSLYFVLGLTFTILLSLVGPLRPLLITEMVNLFVSDGQKESNQIALYIGQSIDWIFPNASTNSQLAHWAVLLFILLFLETIFQFLIAYMGALMGQSVIKDVRIKLFKHIQSFKLKFFDNTPNGTVVTRLISDIEAIAEVFTMGLISILGDMLKIITILVLMFYMSWKVSLLILVPIPLLLFATKLFAKAMKKSFEKERQQVNRLNTFVQEHISGMSIVQIFHKEKEEFNKFKVHNDGHRDAMLQAVNATALFFPMVELLSSLSIGFLLLWSFLQLNYHPEMVNQIAGLIFGYVMWVNMLYRPIRQMADRFNVLQRGVVRAERVFDLLDKSEHIDNTGQLKDIDFNNTIEFKNLWFAYKNEDWVLKGLNLKIEKNTSVAIVGQTGAGKSTIINLLTRFYEFQKGDISIGEHSVRDIELHLLRKNISVVLQDVFLFSDSIYNNITMRDSSISIEKVMEAAKEVGAHDFIMKLPGGYDFNVKERGGVLSVGQKQLIAFIRAYVYNPKILILDEATASVDSESESLIQQATENYKKEEQAL